MNDLITGLDHLIVGTPDFTGDRANLSALLGTPAHWSGRIDGREEAVFLTANVALRLQEDAARRGLRGLCFRCADAPRLQRRLARLNLPVETTEHDDAVGRALEQDAIAPPVWLEPSATRGLSLAFVARDTDAPITVPGRISGLDHAVINSASATGTAFLLGAQLGLDLRLDIDRPDWGGRLLFFRCGDTILEVFERRGGAGVDGGERDAAARSDGFYGLSWRAHDLDTTRAELAALDFDVSDVRAGRKAGTRVLTVRDRCAGVPTLLLEPARR
jgi:hypothetical protein